MNPRTRALQERFMRDTPDRRLGAIASDLIRLSNLLGVGSARSKMVQDVLMELKLFTEWAADELSLAMQEMLLDLQREILCWSPDRKDFDMNGTARSANEWSKKILHSSNLSG